MLAYLKKKQYLCSVIWYDMEDFRSLCRRRRSIRKYQNRPVEPEKIEYMLQCALMSPSSKRTNPWEFVVVHDVDTLRALQDCRTYGSGMFASATAAIAVAVDTTLTDTWQSDAAIAAEHILLAAAEQGVGACWCHVHDREGAPELTRRLFALPENIVVLCVIALGYPDEQRQEYDLSKLKYEKIHNERF